jgi:hypothetical protein
MTLHRPTVYSATSLETWKTCPRQFQLRYVERRPWPVLQADQVAYERHLERARRFHRMAQQYQVGVPAEAIERQADDEGLRRWWQAFTVHADALLQGETYPEITLATEVAGRCIMATYDAVVVDPEAITIVDWKTHERVPSRRRLQGRYQTKVYPLVLADAGRVFPVGRTFSAEQVRMTYWFAARPAESVTFQTNAAALERTRDELAATVHDIEDMPQNEPWPQTTQERACSYCVYRCCCHEDEETLGGAIDSWFDDADGDGLFDFDFAALDECSLD